MRYGKIMAYGLTVVFLLLALGIGRMDDLPEKEAQRLPLIVSLATETGAETITCWEQEPGKYYVFLPSYADLSRLTLQAEAGQSITLNGRQLETSGQTDTIQLNTPYPFHKLTTFYFYNIIPYSQSSRKRHIPSRMCR